MKTGMLDRLMVLLIVNLNMNCLMPSHTFLSPLVFIAVLSCVNLYVYPSNSNDDTDITKYIPKKDFLMEHGQHVRRV